MVEETKNQEKMRRRYEGKREKVETSGITYKELQAHVFKTEKKLSHTHKICVSMRVKSRKNESSRIKSARACV